MTIIIGTILHGYSLFIKCRNGMSISINTRVETGSININKFVCINNKRLYETAKGVLFTGDMDAGVHIFSGIE